MSGTQPVTDTMELTMYQVDAFTDRVFGGNPAAVVPLTSWPSAATMTKIAAENNLAETAFFVPRDDDDDDGYDLRWFAPEAEVDLCGHATLATSDVIFRILEHPRDTIRFHTRSGMLTVAKRGGAYTMDFPATAPQPCEMPEALVQGLGVTPLRVLKAYDYIAVLGSEQEVRSIKPDFGKLAQLDGRGVVVTAAGDSVDIVSRGFFPKLGVNEDPVTGSMHCEVVPLWSQELGRSTLRAEQASRRGGTLTCELAGDRVLLTGTAAHYMTATISVPKE